MRRVRVVVSFDADDASPAELRKRFGRALREAIMRASASGRISLEVAEELWRVVPAEEPRR